MARIIVIEDDANMRHLLVASMRAAGHQAEGASEGKEGLKCHAATAADLIITDIFMPGMEGLETIRELRRLDREVKIIAMTGMNDMGNPLGIAMRFGANRMMEKPFRPHELIAMVKELLLARKTEPEVTPRQRAGTE